MKNTIIILLLFTGFVNAQIVNIPDANFKAVLLAANPGNQIASDFSGNYITIDTNSDGEIQVTEALGVNSIVFYDQNISSLEGINSFANLRAFVCSYNNLTTLDLTNLSDLDILSVDGNPLTSLNLTGLVSLTDLSCINTQLTTLDLTGLLVIDYVMCTGNSQLQNFIGSNLPNLATIYAGQCPQLSFVDVSNSPVTTLDLSDDPAVETLNISGTNLTDVGNIFLTTPQTLQSVNASNCLLLTSFGFNAPIENINIINCPALVSMFFFNSNFTSIDLTGLPSLLSFTMDGGIFNTIDLSQAPTIKSLTLTNLQLTTLDVSPLQDLENLNCSNNPLYLLILKNGVNDLPIIDNTPLLAFVCADESEIPTVSALLAPTTAISSYCSFVPGGDYNTISGSVRVDYDSSGCDGTDPVFPFIRVDISGDATGAAFISNVGNYIFFTQAGNFTVTPQVENAPFFTFSSASATVDFPLVDNSVSINDFCVTPNGIHPDVEVVIAPIIAARPGFDATYKIVYKNKGNQVISGNVALTFDDSLLDFISSIPAPNNQVVNALTFNYSNLLPFENREILITMNVNSPTDTPPVNIGTILNFIAVINPIAGDENVNDNTFDFSQSVVGSYDPNDKTCLEVNVVSANEIGNYLHYIINFENTGTAAATNVVVKDIIDTTQFDISSLQVMNSSHAVEAKITGNIVEFIFKNINLPSAISDPIGGHGNVLFKIKTLPNLPIGTMVTNTANIYFDYNFPIETNEARTTFETLSKTDFVRDESISIYPNPANGFVNIKAATSIKSIQLFDIQGRVLQTLIESKNAMRFDISDKQNGIYFMKITTDKGSTVEKIIKE